MKYKIDPTKLKSTEERRLLRAVLKVSQSGTTWKENFPYSIQSHTIELTHRLILMPAQEGVEPKYQIVSPAVFFENTKSKVSPVLCEMSFPEDQFVAYNPSQSTLVKLQWKELLPQLTSDFVKVKQHEYNYSLKAEHLCVTKLTNLAYKLPGKEVVLCESIMVMKRMPGIELFDFVQAFLPRTSRVHIPSTMRMRLTLEILYAFQKQVYELGIHHGDLKPENMVLDLGIGDDVLPRKLNDQHIRQTKLNIIDYAGCQHFGEPIQNFSASPNYIAPERYTCVIVDGKQQIKPNISPVQDEKPDIFSLGIIIGLIWGIENPLPMDLYQFNSRVAFNRMYFTQEPSWFTLECMFFICSMIRDATRVNPVERSSLVDMIWCAEKITQTYFRPNNPGLFPPSSIPIEELGSDSDSDLEMDSHYLSSVCNSTRKEQSLYDVTPNTVVGITSPAATGRFFASPLPIMDKMAHGNATSQSCTGK